MKKKFEKRRQILELFENGVGVSETSRNVGVCITTVSRLQQLYRLFGKEYLLRDKSSTTYAPEIKQEIVSEHLEKGVSLTDISIKYNVSRSSLCNWIKLVRKNGYGILSESHYCGIEDMKEQRREHSALLDALEENQRLKRELEELRVENALLKKVKALVAARDARLREIGREPSKN